MQLVSILIPNFNKAPYLRETLDSVLYQTYTDWECIIVDDHSTDNSWDILEEYVGKDVRFKIYKRPNTRLPGGNSARNFAFEVSQGEYINWLDSDDIMVQNTIDEKVKILNSNPKLDFVIGDIKKFESKSKEPESFHKLRLFDKNLDPVFGTINGKFWVQTSLPLFRKDFLKSFPTLFNEKIRIGQESEFFTRVFLRDPNFQFNEKAIHLWRIATNSKTSIINNSPFEKKYINNYPALKLIFTHIKKSRGISIEEKIHFKNVFNDRLLYLPFNSIYFWDLLIFGTRNDLFKGRFQGMKIVGIKFIKLFQKD